MALLLDLVTRLQQEPPEPAWKAIVEYAWEVCSKPLPENNAETEITNRDRAIGDLDHFLATAGWDLWLSFEAAVPKTSNALAEWWHEQSHGKAILILDGLSLRETPWILAQATARGFSTKRALVTGAELPAETTAYVAKIAPMVVALCTEQAKDVSGQIFCVRSNEIFLMSQSRPVRSVQKNEGWTPGTVLEHAIPAMKPSMYPLDRSADIFSWDPV